MLTLSEDFMCWKNHAIHTQSMYRFVIQSISQFLYKSSYRQKVTYNDTG